MPKLVLFFFTAASFAVALPCFTACGSGGTCEGATCTSASGTGGAPDAGADGSGGHGGGTFPCKLMTCDLGKEACQVTTDLGQDAMGQCIPLPTACAPADATCSCFGDLMGCMCMKEPDGSFAVFCDTGM
jgi:hypothetical protein